MSAVDGPGTSAPSGAAGGGATPGAGLAELDVCGLSKRFGRDVWALRDVDLRVHPGEFVTLLGPSGSGKTTLLMVIAGFERSTTGEVLLRGDDITTTPPERRNLGVVFQNYALFPTMTVRANVAYPLAARKVARAERLRRAEEMLEIVGLSGFGHRRPSQLSGGQQQRVALARSLVYEPSILLLDEPLGALDRALRERMQVELRNLHRRLGTTFICVTHDQDEALSMSDRVVVMADGRIEQVGPPAEVYDRPASEFVAGFVGSTNLLAGRVAGVAGGRATVEVDGCGPVPVPCPAGLAPGAAVKVVVRPERMHLVVDEPGAGDRAGTEGWPVLAGVVSDTTFVGNRWRGAVATAAGSLSVDLEAQADEGQPVRVTWDPARTWAVAAS